MKNGCAGWYAWPVRFIWMYAGFDANFASYFLCSSAASRVGLRPGDLVLAVNGAEVDTMKEFQTAIAQARKSGQAVLLVQRGYRLQEFAFDLG